MYTNILCLITALLGTVSVLGGPLVERQDVAQPTVTIADGTVVGIVRDNTESFAGIPFAQPPVGALRLKPPQRLNSSFGTLMPRTLALLVDTSNTDFLSQVLEYLVDTPLFMSALNQSEDCLFMTVQRPANTTAEDKLPVVVWIFGGAFEVGWSSMYDGIGVVQRGIDLDQPFVYVALAYRILEDGSANLGLLDQRLALEWVADNIGAFGGDPDKVTLWGESAGSMSIFDQMALYDGDNTYNGKPLFHGAILNSGSIVPAAPVDETKGNDVYNQVLAAAGCSEASSSLECLRGLDYAAFLNAANSVPNILSYQSIALSYLPRPDGKVLTQSPEVLLQTGKYAAVPVIIGDQEDEGTLFSIFQSNLSTVDDIIDYLHDFAFIDASREEVAGFINTFDTSASAGSPYNTGPFNEIYPYFKLMASAVGDILFTLTRRVFLSAFNTAHPDVLSWSYLSSYDYGTPILGSFHGGDILQVFYGILPNYASAATQTYFINFITNGDPNVGTADYPAWPQWSEARQLMQFWSITSSFITDDFRPTSYEYILNNATNLRL
ncbi:Alpha/Beta hydrolase protein [Pestalotiopsis sp. NC0098]|nr:Alpha/Beta hydrolase protein [Pestalotiopsis sp. NC0098]